MARLPVGIGVISVQMFVAGRTFPRFSSRLEWCSICFPVATAENVDLSVEDRRAGVISNIGQRRGSLPGVGCGVINLYHVQRGALIAHAADHIDEPIDSLCGNTPLAVGISASEDQLLLEGSYTAALATAPENGAVEPPNT